MKTRLSKKKFSKFSAKWCAKKGAGHWEGKFFCDCSAGGFRKWMQVKYYGNEQAIFNNDPANV